MTQNTFIDSIQGIVMDGIRWLSDKVFGLFQGGGSRGALATWFAGNWISLLVILIIVGLVVDWVVWLLRWRHYKLWFGAKQQIPVDDPPRRRKRAPEDKRPRPKRDVLPPFEDDGFEDDMGFDGMWPDEARSDAFAYMPADDASFMDDDWYEDEQESMPAKGRGVFSPASQDELDDMFGDDPKRPGANPPARKKPKKRRRV